MKSHDFPGSSVESDTASPKTKPRSSHVNIGNNGVLAGGSDQRRFGDLSIFRRKFPVELRRDYSRGITKGLLSGAATAGASGP